MGRALFLQARVMALTLQSHLGAGIYPELVVRGCQDLPIDLSRRRSPSPQISISLGPNEILDRAMGPPPNLQRVHFEDQQSHQEEDEREPQDLRVRPSHSIIPFHKLRKHSLKSEERTRLKKQRLEEAVSGLLREKEPGPAAEKHLSPAGGHRQHQPRAEPLQRMEEASPPAAPPPVPSSMLQQMLMMQQPSTQPAYPSLLYLQYCAMLQSLQLQQAIRQQQPPEPMPSCSTPRRPNSVSSASTSGTPPTTPDTPPTPPGDAATPLRRRAPRTLTGKHVRQGRGASAETLQLLRKVLLEKARLRELGLLPPPKPKPKARGRRK